MRMEELETKVKMLENQLRTVQDIQEIEKLQRIYGYYLEHWMVPEILDLFSDGPDVALEWPEGTYLGQEGVKRYFIGDGTWNKQNNPEFIHQLMQVSPVIDIDPDGKTAKGRWYSFGGVAKPLGGGVKQGFMSGTYENEYAKEGGKWKIKRIRWMLNFWATPAEGWVKPERVAAIDPKAKFTNPKPDIPPSDFDTSYPSGYIFPFHYKHPITEKKTNEEQHNATLKTSRNN
ncbi:MAG: nuclear transport factor 2 family protein [Promethearchaeota archaeon]